MKNKCFGKISLWVLMGSLCTSALWAAETAPITPAPGQTAVESPTPQPPQLVSPSSAQKQPVPAPLSRDSHGAPVVVVEFETDHSDIPSSFHRELNVFGKYLAKHPGSTAQLTGYADNTGHGPANGTLSQKRADAVMAYLVSHSGISASRIKAEGAGPIVDKINNSTAASQQADRRVYGNITQAQ
jgi:OOP family OmpA-OmpF porin